MGSRGSHNIVPGRRQVDTTSTRLLARLDGSTGESELALLLTLMSIPVFVRYLPNFPLHSETPIRLKSNTMILSGVKYPRP